MEEGSKLTLVMPRKKGVGGLLECLWRGWEQEGEDGEVETKWMVRKKEERGRHVGGIAQLLYRAALRQFE